MGLKNSDIGEVGVAQGQSALLGPPGPWCGQEGQDCDRRDRGVGVRRAWGPEVCIHRAVLSESSGQGPCPPAGGGQPVSQRAVGLPGLKDKGRRGQGKELVAGSLMAPKKNHKTGELWET